MMLLHCFQLHALHAKLFVAHMSEMLYRCLQLKILIKILMFWKTVLKSISENRRFCYRGASKWKVPFALCRFLKKHQKTFEGCLHLNADCVIRVMLLALFWSLGHREIVRQVVKINEIQDTLTIP